jgi:hypothetical protein
MYFCIWPDRVRQDVHDDGRLGKISCLAIEMIIYLFAIVLVVCDSMT